MYVLGIIRYRRPIEEVSAHVEAHRAYLGGLKELGLLVASGPMDPRSGGAVLFRLPDDILDPEIDKIRDEDPFVKAGVAQYELLRWNVIIGRDDLDRV